MYKDVLRAIDNIDILPVVGLLIFFIFFTLMLIEVFQIGKNDIKRMEQLPFEFDSDQNTAQNERKNT